MTTPLAPCGRCGQPVRWTPAGFAHDATGSADCATFAAGDRVAVPLLDGTAGYAVTGREDHGTIVAVIPDPLGITLRVRWDDGTVCSVGEREARRLEGSLR